MIESIQISHIVKLLDDESPVVRDAVFNALDSIGPSLDQALANLPEPLTDDQMKIIREWREQHQNRDRDIAALVGTEKIEEPRVLFQPGQLVKHSQYGYRGVVVSYDMTCQASDHWYQSNKTQPSRSQPWYHVLVHGGNQVTYPAQSGLVPDDSNDEIVHPLVALFFSEFKNGRYVRNHEPWPDEK